MTLGGGDDRAFGGRGDDVVNCGDGDDVVRGGPGDDVLRGGPGDDALTGGPGRDELQGGPGDDAFIFLVLADGGTRAATRDVILDFARNADVLDFGRIDARPTTARDDAFAFRGHLAFSGAPGELRLRDTDDGLVVELNVNRTLRPELTLLLDDVFVLNESDIVL